MEINSAILSSQLQLITITESWIQTNESDDFLKKNVCLEFIFHCPFPVSFRLVVVFISYIEKIFLFLLIKVYAIEHSKLLH